MTPYQISAVGEADRSRLVEVWEASVRATHHFLSEADVAAFRPLVRDGLLGSLELACVRDADGRLVGFVGVSAGRIEALFVDPGVRGIGIGRRLLEHATRALRAHSLHVNEQNDQAVGFYLRMGFEVQGRSERDAMGKPFPLLHMRLGRRAAATQE